MSDFKPGEIVDVTIKGVPVDAVHADGTPDIIAEDSDGLATVWALPPQAKVERVAPAEWPPQPGDLWKDVHGKPYWAVGAYRGQTDRLLDKGGAGWNADRLNQDYGPLTLVHREGVEGNA